MEVPRHYHMAIDILRVHLGLDEHEAIEILIKNKTIKNPETLLENKERVEFSTLKKPSIK